MKVFVSSGLRQIGAHIVEMLLDRGDKVLTVDNLATGKETTILELAIWMREFTGNETLLDLRPARDWDRSGNRFAAAEKSSR